MNNPHPFIIHRKPECVHVGDFLVTGNDENMDYQRVNGVRLDAQTGMVEISLDYDMVKFFEVDGMVAVV